MSGHASPGSTPSPADDRSALLAERVRRARGEQRERSAISKRSDEGDAPLSSNQLRLWYLDQFEDGGAVNNLSAAYRLSGCLDVEALERSLSTLLVRHEALRLYVVESDGLPVQRDSHETKPELPVVDVRGEDRLAREEALDEQLRSFCRQKIALTDPPLFRTALFRVDEREHVLCLVAHHAIFDGWSLDLFMAELGAAYTTVVAGAAPPLAPAAIQYTDFAAWQRRTAEGEEVQTQLEFWLEHLKGPLPVLELPLDHARPAEQSFAGACLRWSLPRERVERLTELARAENATLFMVLLAAYDVLLHRYSGQSDLVVGTPIAGRDRPEIQTTIGFFANTIALRADLTGNPTFRELLARVRVTCLDAFSNPDVPFERLVEKLQPTRDLSRTPVYQTLFSFEERRAGEARFADLDLSSVDLPLDVARTDLTWWLESSGTGLDIIAEYPTDLFEAGTVARMLRHYDRLLSRLCASPDEAIGDLTMLDEADHACFSDWNATARDVATDRSLAEWLSADWTRHGNQPALVTGGSVMSYRGVEASANRLAHYLAQQGVTPGSLVGLCLDRSPDLIVAALAVWKAGAGYVPLDPDYPTDRLERMVETAGLDLIVSTSGLGDTLPDFGGRWVKLDADADAIGTCQGEPPTVAPDPEARAYVIFTSGSTGEPKGVEVPQRAVVNFLASMARRPGLDPTDRLLAVTTLSFDISVLELFLPLLTGGAVVLATGSETGDGTQLLELIRRHKVGVMQATPTTWRLLLAAGWEGDPSFRALCGGEALPPDLARQLLPLVGELWNMYGPTETTVWSTCQRIETADEPVLVGRPIDNTTCHILDDELRPLPIGVTGELYIGGLGVALGYLGQPELTADRFIPDPFGADSPGRLYRTGDRARWLDSGRLECFGRTDGQVKLRGHRIELGEIEAWLGQLEAIDACAVLLREDRTGDPRLVAYATLRGDADLTVTEMRRHLRHRLPETMVPSQLVVLSELPLTHNGKIDRTRLPAPEFVHAAPGATRVPPETPAEAYLAELWAELLGVGEIGAEDNFFDVGGHSLLAARVVARIRSECGVEVPLRLLVLGTLRTIADAHLAGTALSRSPDTARRSLVGRLFDRLGGPH